MNNLRESMARLALFLFCVVILSICLGMLLSTLHMPIRTAKLVAEGATVVGAIASYLASYKPGWLYKSLLETSKGEQ